MRDQVLVDLLDRTALVRGQHEGQGADPRRDLLPAVGQANAAIAGDSTASSRDEGRLVEEELLEGEALPGRLGGMLVRREVRGDQSIIGAGQTELAAQATGDRLDHVARLWDRLPDPLADSLRAQPLARRVDRDDPRRVQAGLG